MRDDALSRVFNVKGRTSTECKTRALNILAADVVGYSRLMEADEAGTLTRLKTIRLELIDPAIAKCKGRSVKTTGDGMLVEFQSVTEAVRCAVELDDIFAIQDEITSAIVATLFGRVEAARHNRVQPQTNRQHGCVRMRPDWKSFASLVDPRSQCRGASDA
jgi:class 3 adenylate cyclase